MVVKTVCINQQVYEYRCLKQENSDVFVTVLLPTGQTKCFIAQDIKLLDDGKKILFCIEQQLHAYRLGLTINGSTPVYNLQQQQVVLATEQGKKRSSTFMPATGYASQSTISPATDLAPDALVIKSPLAGRVMRILVKEGQVIACGLPLLTIESMKMENELCASSAGYIKTILIREGDVVQQKQVVITLSIEGEGHATQYSEHESAPVSDWGSSQRTES